MKGQRVAFRLEANRVFVHTAEQLVTERLRPYKRQRTGQRSAVANREIDPERYIKRARALERAAHENAVKVAQHDRAEVVMALLGKMRHHPEQCHLWSTTGLDASAEDRSAEAEAVDRVVAELAEELNEMAEEDRSEGEGLTFEQIETCLFQN